MKTVDLIDKKLKKFIFISFMFPSSFLGKKNYILTFHLAAAFQRNQIYEKLQ